MKNLIIRAVTGIIFVALLVGAICLHPVAFTVLFALITGLSLWEFYGLIGHYEEARLQRAVSCAGGMYLFIATFCHVCGGATAAVFLPYLLFLIYTFTSELYKKAPNPINNWAFTLLAQIYLAGSFSLLNLLAAAPGTVSDGFDYSPLFVLSLFVFIWLNDTGAYLFGSMLGRHRLFERISPKKSWEGFFGGLILVLAASQLLPCFEPGISRMNGLGLALTIVLFGTWGDLTESLLKRTLQVKDSGHILPGHGGMLDRFDSALMAIPAAYIYIECFIRN